MGKLNLHIGPQKDYYYFKDKIISHIESSQTDSYIYILPVNRAVRYFKKELVTISSQSALMDPPVFTFSSLMQHFYRQIDGSKKIINNSMRLLLVERALEQLSVGQLSVEQLPAELNYFKNKRLTHGGLVKKIDAMLRELCQFGYQPGVHKQAPVTCADKYNDFITILNAVLEKYDNRMIDENLLVLETIDIINETRFKKVFPKVREIYINGYGIYTPPMTDFFRKVKDWCNVNIKLEFDPDNPELFRHTFDAYDSMQTIADNIVTDQESQSVISSCLFKTYNKIAGNNENKKLFFQKTQNRIQEISFIAAKIKHLHFTDRIPLHKIGVTFPNLEIYVPLIRSVFKQYEIPYNLSTGFSLSQSPLIHSFLKVIKVVLTDFESKEVFNLLSSQFISSNINLGLLKKTAIRLRIKNFNHDWQKPFYKYIESKESGNTIEDAFQKKEDIDSLKEIGNRLSQIFPCLNKLSGDKSIEKFHDIYLNVLKDSGLLDWYDNSGNLSEQEREKEFRAFNKFISVLDQILWMLKYLKGEQKISLGDYYKYLKLIIEESTYNLREWPDYGVQIMPRLEIQSAEPEILFIGGLVEGEFPRKFSRDIFFNDEERQELGLHASEDLLAQDRYLFYQLISSQAEKTILTYPAFEEEASLLPSTFISGLQDVMEISVGDEDIGEQNIFSKKGLDEYLGKKLPSGLSDNDLKLFFQKLKYTKEKDIDLWLESVEIQSLKKSRRTISHFEGDLTRNKQISHLLDQKKANKPFSITALESYAFCPMQYFQERILHLEEEEDFGEIITPLERGALVHNIFYRFYSNLKQSGNQNRPWENQPLLEQTASEEFAKLPYQGLLWTLEKEKIFGNESQPGLLEKFLQIEKEEILETGFIPSYFEYAFGKTGKSPKKDNNSTTKPVIIKRGGREIKLFGKIDRIDVDKKGNAIVFDYKTGSGSNLINFRQIFEGSSLQLPVYIKAVEESGLKLTPIAGGYYQVRDTENCGRKITFTDNNLNPDLLKRGNGKLPNKTYDLSFDELLEKSMDFVTEYIEDIITGHFEHTKYPDDPRCSSYCALSKICRKDIGKIMNLNK